MLPDRDYTPDELSLTSEERDILVGGVSRYWGSAVRAPHFLAILLDAASIDEALWVMGEITGKLRRGVSLTPLEWTRALVCTEIVFGSDTVGAGIEWEAIMGPGDAETLELLRSIQRKLSGVTAWIRRRWSEGETARTTRPVRRSPGADANTDP